MIKLQAQIIKEIEVAVTLNGKPVEIGQKLFYLHRWIESHNDIKKIRQVTIVDICWDKNANLQIAYQMSGQLHTYYVSIYKNISKIDSLPSWRTYVHFSEVTPVMNGVSDNLFVTREDAIAFMLDVFRREIEDKKEEKKQIQKRIDELGISVKKIKAQLRINE